MEFRRRNQNQNRNSKIEIEISTKLTYNFVGILISSQVKKDFRGNPSFRHPRKIEKPVINLLFCKQADKIRMLCCMRGCRVNINREWGVE
jgi:hypothetical protein